MITQCAKCAATIVPNKGGWLCTNGFRTCLGWGQHEHAPLTSSQSQPTERQS